MNHRNERDGVGQMPRRPVKRRRRRRGSLFLFYVAFGILLTATGVSLSLTVFFNADTITVTGETSYSAEEIIEVSGVKKTDNLFRLKANRGQTAILNTFPYIENVAIVRRFPTSVEIKVTAAVPDFQFSQEDKIVLVNRDGRVLETNLDKPVAGVTLVKGIAAENPMPCGKLQYTDEEIGTLAAFILSELARQGYEQVGSLDMTQLYDICVLYDNRFILKIGSPSDLEYKLGYAKRVIDTELTPETEGILDLSRITASKTDIYLSRRPIDASDSSEPFEPVT